MVVWRPVLPVRSTFFPAEDVRDLPPVEKQLAYYELDIGLNHVT
jgi:hypothetical protein